MKLAALDSSWQLHGGRVIVASMMKNINLEARTDLSRLYAELQVALQRAAAIFRSDPPGTILDGPNLARFLAEEENVAGILRRLKEIQRVQPPTL